MAIVEREAADHFRVRFAELARKVVKGWRRDHGVELDPFLLARAVAEVMAACTYRTARGQRLLWNDYRVILARADFERVRALQGLLERDLGQALAGEAAATGAELVGELQVSVVYDESDELRSGEGVVRVGFVPTARMPDARSGEMTVRFDAAHLDGLMKATGSTETVIVQDTGPGLAPLRLRWPGGEASLPAATTSTAGRPHAGAPGAFVALTGASARISRQQVWIEPVAGQVRIGRPAAANPVHVAGTAIAPGGELIIAAPVGPERVEIVLSRGELVLHLTAE